MVYKNHIVTFHSAEQPEGILMLKKLCASIITYNPSIEQLKINIDAVKMNGIECIVIIDNASEHPEKIIALTHGLKDMRCIFLQNTKNLGVAQALNQCVTEAAEAGYEWLLTLDQDSVIEDGYVEGMRRNMNSNNDIGAVAPRICDKMHMTEDNQHISFFQRKLRWYVRKDSGILPITSGLLMNVKAAVAVGGFTNELFIDSVDFDFDLKLYEHRFEILKANNAKLDHSLGKPNGHYLFGWYFISSGHPAWRYYYMARNTWFIFFGHHKNNVSKKLVWHALLRSICPLLILNVLISNNWDKQYLKYIFAGHLDGLRKKIRPHDEVIKMFS